MSHSERKKQKTLLFYGFEKTELSPSDGNKTNERILDTSMRLENLGTSEIDSFEDDVFTFSSPKSKYTTFSLDSLVNDRKSELKVKEKHEELLKEIEQMEESKNALNEDEEEIKSSIDSFLKLHVEDGEEVNEEYECNLPAYFSYRQPKILFNMSIFSKDITHFVSSLNHGDFMWYLEEMSRDERNSAIRLMLRIVAFSSDYELVYLVFREISTLCIDFDKLEFEDLQSLGLCASANCKTPKTRHKKSIKYKYGTNIKLLLDTLSHFVKEGYVSLEIEEANTFIVSLYKILVDHRLQAIIPSISNLLANVIDYYIKNLTRQMQLLCRSLCPFENQFDLGLYSLFVSLTPINGEHGYFNCILAFYILQRYIMKTNYDDMSLDYYTSFGLKDIYNLIRHPDFFNNHDIDDLKHIILMLRVCTGYISLNSYKDQREIWLAIRLQLLNMCKKLKEKRTLDQRISAVKEDIITMTTSIQILVNRSK